jgi:outer membrane protein TolC
VEGAARIEAVKAAEKAAALALDSNKKGVPSGTRNVLDVFNAEQQLASVRRDLAEARIQYILSRLRLQALTGSLNEVEIEAVNAWLTEKSPTSDASLSKR